MCPGLACVVDAEKSRAGKFTAVIEDLCGFKTRARR
jgi:hypothetical protein